MNDKRQNQYLILPEHGNRKDTKLAVEYDEAQIAEYLKQGYVIVNHDNFNKLIGNGDGEYVAPARERGLKCHVHQSTSAATRGRSREGAWIEIGIIGTITSTLAGRSREGAWIEIIGHD